MSWVFYIALALVVGWVSYRLWWLGRRALRRRREGRSAPFHCPKCRSLHTDDYSDADSGYCLACGHVWGIYVPRE